MNSKVPKDNEFSISLYVKGNIHISVLKMKNTWENLCTKLMSNYELIKIPISLYVKQNIHISLLKDAKYTGKFKLDENKRNL